MVNTIARAGVVALGRVPQPLAPQAKSHVLCHFSMEMLRNFPVPRQLNSPTYPTRPVPPPPYKYQPKPPHSAHRETITTIRRALQTLQQHEQAPDRASNVQYAAMAFRLSNNVIGALNLVTLLLSVPVLGAGIWLGTRGDGTECDRYLSSPVIALGAFLMAVSLAGLVGACCRVTWLLWVYLLAMFALIVALLCFTAFAFAVTHRGAGEAVSGRGFKEYRLGDYSTWLQRHVERSKNWDRIRSCLTGANVCRSLQERNPTLAQLASVDLSPIQSGCCKPPTSCNFTYAGNGTEWTKTASLASADPDCDAWSNDAGALCYGCQSCKAGVVATLKRDWKRVAIVNAVFLALIIVIYSIGCCAFRHSRRDNAYRSGGWKQGGYA